jgi:hypothetical protein
MVSTGSACWAEGAWPRAASSNATAINPTVVILPQNVANLSHPGNAADLVEEVQHQHDVIADGQRGAFEDRKAAAIGVQIERLANDCGEDAVYCGTSFVISMRAPP